MLLVMLGIVVVLWFVIGQFLSRKSKSVAIGYSVGLLGALIASIPFIMAAASVRDYVVQRKANAAGFASVQDHWQAQSLGYSTKAAYDQARAELEASRRSAHESHARLQEETAADERRRARLWLLTERTQNSPPPTSTSTASTLATSSGPARSFADLERDVRKLLAIGERLNRNNPSTCGNQMRVLQPQAKELRAQINRLPLTAERVYLGAAATGVNLCVSCNKSLGPQHCNLARQALQELR